jgi:hypothetical protein
MTNCAAALSAGFGHGTLQCMRAKYRGGWTHNQVSITSAMHLVCNVDGAASVFGDRIFAFFGGLEVPDCVVVFWVLAQLLGGHGRHGDVVLVGTIIDVYRWGGVSANHHFHGTLVTNM